MNQTIALLLGFLLDLLLGDPAWMPHPVRWQGWAIARLEVLLRRVFPKTPGGERAAGFVLAALLPLGSWAIAWAMLRGCAAVSPWLRLAAESWMCYQVLALCELRRESMRVFDRLREGDLPGARAAVARIVGRDTAALDLPGVTRAAVETVAENTSDGVAAPLFYLALFGAPGGLAYKAVNTMDSMVGYRNERYRFFGFAAARLDDLANWLPARLCALAMIAAAPLCRLSGAGALRIWRRDRRRHASPNSAQTEAACAGALGVQLAGPACYFGKRVEKPFIGDPLRPVEPEDIRRANRLSFFASLIFLMAALALRLIFC